jgi:predicted nucleic acid-binding protein
MAAIGRLDLIHALFDSVLIPQAVETEVNAAKNFAAAKAQGRKTIRETWISVVPVVEIPYLRWLHDRLGAGEAEAITLAIDRGLEILLDDLPARKAATRLNVRPIGTLGILAGAKNRGVIDEVRPFVQALQIAGIFYSGDLLDRFFQTMGEA